MKKIYILLAVSFFTISLSPLRATELGTITLHVSGFTSDEGSLLVSLANSSETHPRGAEPFLRAERLVEGGTVEVVFSDIPYWEYSIKLFHDVNGNKELDANLLGIPKEPYGYSKNARPRFAAPIWKETKFNLDSENVVQRIEVK